MSPGRVVNVPASVRQRLLNLARRDGTDFQRLLERYAIERILYRLSISPHADRFVLKGAMLFVLWTDAPYRPTRDLDLLGMGPSDPESLGATFAEIAQLQEPEDGLLFDEGSVRVEQINVDQEYEGVRITMRADLDGARIPMQIDVAFGAAVHPAPDVADFPSLLDLPRPRIRAYPKEVTIAEKYQAMVDLGVANTRMKDFSDISQLAQMFAFEGGRLCAAIAATFDQRGTPVPSEPPLALTTEFSEDVTKRTQWVAFLGRSGLSTDGADLGAVVELLRGFLLPPSRAVALEKEFPQRWPPGGSWEAAG